MPDISKIYTSDTHAQKEVDALLAAEGIRRDRNLDYTCGVYDDAYEHLIATGSCFKNTLRCFAVSDKHQGEGLLLEQRTHASHRGTTQARQCAFFPLHEMLLCEILR